jgi:hypothetical protein
MRNILSPWIVILSSTATHMLALREGQSQELFRELMCPMIKDAFPPEYWEHSPRAAKK